MNFKKIFFEYASTSPFLPIITDAKQFFIMRQKLLGEATPRQSQAALSASIADLDNDQTDETVTANKLIYDKNDTLFVHYTHEKRLNH